MVFSFTSLSLSLLSSSSFFLDTYSIYVYKDGIYTYQGSDEADASEEWNGYMLDNEFKNNEFDGGVKIQQSTDITITGEPGLSLRDKEVHTYSSNFS